MKFENIMIVGIACLIGAVSPGCKSLEKGAKKIGVPSKTVNAAKGVSDSFKDTSLSDERDIGEMLALQAYATEGFGKPIKDERVMRYVNTLTAIIGRYSDRPLIPYFIAVIDNEKSNAFATPGGYIFLTKGAILAMKSEAELACVIGHEIAHVTLRHALGTIRRTKGLSSAGKFVASVAGADPKILDDLIKKVCSSLLNNAFDSGDELGADTKGISFAFAAGYDPRAMLEFVDTVDKNTKDLQGAFTSHPSPDKRRSAINDYLAELDAEDMEGLVKSTARFEAFKEMIRNYKDSW
jgi:beta-barrel assembly-enhancing protease